MMKSLLTLALLCVCFLGVWCIERPWPKETFLERIRQRRQSSIEDEDQTFLDGYTAANMGEMRIATKRQTTSEKLEFLNAHNYRRRNVRPSAANMRQMRWSNELATIALNHAKRCQFSHNSARSSQSQSFSYVGENLYLGPGSPSDAVRLWNAEKSNYDFSSNTCNGVCGHYTQVVWANSEYLGCARVRCGTNYLIVCNYGPGGNYINQRPYIRGTPCSRCPRGYTCNNKLCRKS